jgi:uncharacterized cupredoxin-like copper-binding protein
MKKVLLILFLAAIFAACDNTKKEAKETFADTKAENKVEPSAAVAEKSTKGKFKFEEMLHDFGTVDEGEVVTHVFKFTNVGEEPLIIQNARGSCGCTVPKYSDEPVQPGETGEITVNFNTNGRPNAQSKTVTLLANTDPPQTTLKIKAMVTPKANPNQPMGPVK